MRVQTFAQLCCLVFLCMFLISCAVQIATPQEIEQVEMENMSYSEALSIIKSNFKCADKVRKRGGEFWSENDLYCGWCTLCGPLDSGSFTILYVKTSPRNTLPNSSSTPYQWISDQTTVAFSDIKARFQQIESGLGYAQKIIVMIEYIDYSGNTSSFQYNTDNKEKALKLYKAFRVLSGSD